MLQKLLDGGPLVALCELRPSKRLEVVGWLMLLVGAVWITIAGVASARKSSVDEETVRAAYHLSRSLVGQATPEGASKSGQSVGYALMLSALAVTTPGTQAGMACWGQQRADCGTARIPFVIAAPTELTRSMSTK